MRLPVALAIATALAAPTGPQPGAERPSPAARPAIDGVIDALRAHQLVAISDPHGNAAMRDFLRQLFADARFPDLVDDIVLEVGNARYQTLVDDYVNGGAVDEPTLAEAWLNTTVANQISADVEWFRQVRRINAARPRDQRLRILLGDPPIDWSAVKTRGDHFKWLAQRDSYPAAVIRTQVLGRGRRGLIIYGHLHFQRRNVASNFEVGDWRTETIVSLIEGSGPTRVFTIWRVDENLMQLLPDAAAWTTPAFATVAGTNLGAADAGRLAPGGPAGVRISLRDGKPLPKDRYATLPIEQQLDAVLYLGPGSRAPIVPSAEVCKRPGFVDERLRRIALTGIPTFEADNIRKLCAAAAQ